MKKQHVCVAQVLLWHSKEERYVQPGEEADLSHLQDHDIRMLLNMGAIKMIRGAIKTEEEVGDGTDN